jgi:hypothetical protein
MKTYGVVDVEIDVDVNGRIIKDARMRTDFILLRTGCVSGLLRAGSCWK